MLTVTLKLKSIHNIITHIYLHMHIVMYTSRVDSVRSVHTVPFFFSFFHFSSNCLNLSGFVFKAFCIRTCVCVCARFANRGTTIRELWFSFSLSILDNKRKNGAKHILKRLRMPKGFYCRLLKFGAIKDGVSKRCRQVVTRLPLWILHWLYYPSCAESSHIHPQKAHWFRFPVLVHVHLELNHIILRTQVHHLTIHLS